MGLVAHPVLSPQEAKDFESRFFGGDEEAEWGAMQAAGAAIARGVLSDHAILGTWPDRPRLLVLVGKGHNGGDALIAARCLLTTLPAAEADVVFAGASTGLRPNTQRAWRDLVHAGGGRVATRDPASLSGRAYEMSLDGVFGFQFRPPVAEDMARLFGAVNGAPVRMRVAVDLPSGLGSEFVLRADVTYATGILKTTVLEAGNRPACGRLRYLDLGFFAGPVAMPNVPERVLASATLAPLRGWRDALSDKRHYGHLFLAGGSRSYPGAVLMAAEAALFAGVGLLTVFVPETLVAAYAARLPEAMWVGCPETPDGGLALEALHLLRERRSRASALVLGPGLTRERECLAFAREAVAALELPCVLDADALQPEVLEAVRGSAIATPHAGEFLRIAGAEALRSYAARTGVTTVLKGSPTRISDGRSVYVSVHGGPVLARGGSGDMLAGIIGARLAQQPAEPLRTACEGVLWHGMAADLLARHTGEISARSTQLLQMLPKVLQSSDYS